MESIDEYMNRMHEQLANDYRTADGKHRESCFFVAREVQEKFKSEGIISRIHFVRSAKIRDKMNNRDVIVPKRFSGKIAWYVHVVATAESMVWDPMIGKPINIEDYCKVAFEGDTEILPCRYVA